MPQKHDDATATQKILALYSLLVLDDRPRALVELAQRFNCSKPTIMRLMEKIGRFEGVTLREEMRAADGKVQKWYWLERAPADGERRSMGLSAEQMRLLRLCRDIAAPFLPVDVRTELDNSLLRASVLLPPETRSSKAGQRVLPLVQPAILGGIDYGPFQRILHTLLAAMEERRVCEITYAPADKQQRVHEMAVTGMVSGRGALYLRGWKMNTKGTVEVLHSLFLAVHRIKSATLTRCTHDLTAPPEDEGFGIMDGEAFTVRAQCDASAASYVRERHFGPDQSVDEQPNGDVLLAFTARSRPEVVSWALSFGENITIFEPDWLVEEVRWNAKVLLSRHR